uniref:UEV domain-containing protein n=1 Tax=Nothobranchius furzeri TaxID=105023 RepID=A0A8C6PX97_NOTFU
SEIIWLSEKKLICEYFPYLTVREIFNVVTQYRDLKPVMDAYVFNDGSSRDLMSLTGTVPVSYRGKNGVCVCVCVCMVVCPMCLCVAL